MLIYCFILDDFAWVHKNIWNIILRRWFFFRNCSQFHFSVPIRYWDVLWVCVCVLFSFLFIFFVLFHLCLKSLCATILPILKSYWGFRLHSLRIVSKIHTKWVFMVFALWFIVMRRCCEPFYSRAPSTLYLYS